MSHCKPGMTMPEEEPAAKKPRPLRKSLNDRVAEKGITLDPKLAGLPRSQRRRILKKEARRLKHIKTATIAGDSVIAKLLKKAQETA